MNNKTTVLEDELPFEECGGRIDVSKTSFAAHCWLSKRTSVRRLLDEHNGIDLWNTSTLSIVSPTVPDFSAPEKSQRHTASS